MSSNDNAWWRVPRPLGAWRRVLACTALIGLATWIGPFDDARAAAACGGTHVIKTGETIQDIGARYYQSREMWTALYYANADLLGQALDRLPVGEELHIPCLSELDRSEAEPSALFKPPPEAELKLLTGGDYAPFTSKELPGHGLITELVKGAFELAPRPVTFSITWESDWSRHLDPLLLDHRFDAGFPWLKPDCEGNPGHFRCRNFHFSEPLVEVLVQLFVRRDDFLAFEEDSDLYGTSLCRPAGYYTHDLDREGRRWLTQDKIRLVRAASPTRCFEKLMNGTVDGVTINEFLGRRIIHEMGLEDRVQAAPRPISIQGLHLVVPKTHPRATTFLYRFNAGVRALKREDRYSAIVKRHMAAHWDRL